MSKSEEYKNKKTQEIKEKLKNGQLKIVMGSEDKLNTYPDIKKYFLQRVLPPPVLITDHSYLRDFKLYFDGVRLQCLDQFNVDIKPVMDKKLWEIFEYIDSKPAPTITVEELADQLGLTRAK